MLAGPVTDEMTGDRFLSLREDRIVLGLARYALRRGETKVLRCLWLAWPRTLRTGCRVWRRRGGVCFCWARHNRLTTSCNYAVKRLRPLRLRLLMTARPFFVAMRARTPCVRLRRIREG